jgi:4-alpha-glucanotransferase
MCAFNHLSLKEKGVLLHLSSLPNSFGIGDLGPAAYAFADYLVEHDFGIWQLLPLNICGYGNSPYNPISAFAHNPLLISPQMLYEDGLVSSDALYSVPASNKVDYPLVTKLKMPLLKKAAQNYIQRHDIYEYIDVNIKWILLYLSYLHYSRLYGHDRWYLWGEEHRQANLLKIDDLDSELLEAAAIQAIFDDQFQRLSKYLKRKKIRLFGDIPLYLSYESAELWANQSLFDLDEEGRRLSVAGVPPDAFAEGGQLWGNPTYDWQSMQKDGFELFLRRIEHALDCFDLLRLDHFIGYVNFWKVPSPNGILPEDAKGGYWENALPESFFEKLRAKFPLQRFVAEDLGVLSDDVISMREKLALPGMIVLQFCFDSGIPEPQNYPTDRIIYTGTHDNHSTRGWWDALALDAPARKNLEAYCKKHLMDFPRSQNIHHILTQIAQKSGCRISIIPMQDLIGSPMRMNTPGTALGNWEWRLKSL